MEALEQDLAKSGSFPRSNRYSDPEMLVTEPGVPAAAALCQRKSQEHKRSLRYSREKVNHRHGHTELCLESSTAGSCGPTCGRGWQGDQDKP